MDMAEKRDSQASDQERTNKSKEERTRASKSEQVPYCIRLLLLPLTTGATTVSVYSSSSSQNTPSRALPHTAACRRRSGPRTDMGTCEGRERA